MKQSQIWTLYALLALGLAHTANANVITFVSTFDPANENPATVQAAAQIQLNDPDIIDAFRAESPLGSTNAYGTFSVTLIPNGTTGMTESITFSLKPGYVLAGIFVFGGNLGGNFYSVNDETAGVNEGTVNAPLAGKSGMFADLSHLDFFVEPASVPDGGTTLMMLGGALAGLGGLRRYLKK
jgi:VPDSG-CTERM motif